ncbi:MAG: hypothetical protein ACK5X6_00070 [Chryseotalea sp.]
MKTTILTSILITLSLLVRAQAQQENNIRTIFTHGKSGGYGAINNKFTSIHGEFANIVEVYGGWYINQRFLLGVGGGATTNFIKVPASESIAPNERMSYMYGQAGMVNEYVLGSNSPVHAVIHWFNGAGFQLQYNRPNFYNDYDYNYRDINSDTEWFYVTEPGIQVELNLFKWMRVSPGVSYRFAFEDGGKLNNDISGFNASLAFKFGKF